MTKEQYRLQNKDLRTRIANMRVTRQISEDGLLREMQELKQELRSKDKQIKMLQSYIASGEEAYQQISEEKAALQQKCDGLSKKCESFKDTVNILTARINKNSSNSSKPSSTNGFTKVVHNSRKFTSKKPGGQPGHPGHGLSLSKKLMEQIKAGKAKVEVVEHGKASGEYVSKYELDIQIATILREHRFYRGVSIPDRLKNPVNYGPNMKAICVDLSMEGLISAERVSEFIGAISDGVMKPSKASILAFQNEMSGLLDGELEAIRENVLNSSVLHVDETPVKSTQRPADNHVMEEARGTSFNLCIRTYSTMDSVFLTVNPHKNIAGVLKDYVLPQYTGVGMHDHDLKYYNFEACRQGECNAHVIRYLIGMEELTKHGWAAKMVELLLEMQAHKEKDMANQIFSMNAQALREYSNRYDEILSLGKTEARTLSEKSPIRKDERNLLSRLEKYKENHLLFAYDYSVPFTNNEAERSFRWIKTQQKVSGCHRSYHGVEISVRLMSFLLTLRKRKMSIFEAMKNLLNHQPVLTG